MELYKPEYEKIYHFSIQNQNTNEKATDRKLFIYHYDLDKLSKSIKKEISNMVKLPSTSNVDVNIVEIISSIDSCGFLKSCDSLLKTPLYTEHTIGNLDTNFYDFIQLHKQLSKYKFKKYSYKFKKMTDNEIIAMRDEQTIVLQELQRLNMMQDNMTFYKNGILYRIKNGKLLQ